MIISIIYLFIQNQRQKDKRTTYTVEVHKNTQIYSARKVRKDKKVKTDTEHKNNTKQHYSQKLKKWQLRGTAT